MNRNKRDELIKELQMHIGNEKLNAIIDEKMNDVWRNCCNEIEQEYYAMRKKYFGTLVKNLSKEEYKKMEESHHFSWNESDDSEPCVWCELDLNYFYKEPQYCQNSPSNDQTAEKSV